MPPPPTKKKSGHQFSRSSGRVPIFLVGTPSETAAGVCPENFGSPPSQKNQDTILPAVSRRVPIFFSGHPLKPQRERVPKISGNPPPFGGGSKGLRGCRYSSGLFLLVSSNTPFMFLGIFPCHGRKLDIDMHPMSKTDKL